MHTYIIAEIGVNHNGSFELAKSLIDAACETGADCVKFQTYITEQLVVNDAPMAEYQTINTKKKESQFEMLKKLELSFQDFEMLFDYCKKKKIDFLSTAFDLDSAFFLSDLGMKIWKVPSGEITNLPLLEYIGTQNAKILLSTGMSSNDEVEDAINVLNKCGNNEITLLHCTTEYPAPYDSVNLRAMCSLRDEFGLKVGYSDHTVGKEVSIAAVAMGAQVIEKHFTLDKNMDGPDHKASSDPNEFRDMVISIRTIEKALGNGIKTPQNVELKNRMVARKSIVAAKDIKKGQIISKDMLAVKRPGTGISPMRLYDIVGRNAIRDFKKDELIQI